MNENELIAENENIPDINPTTGRIVWFWPEREVLEKMGIPFVSDIPFPAMVIKGSKTGTANLKVFTMAIDFVAADIPYTRSNKTGCWCWPDRANEPTVNVNINRLVDKIEISTK